MTSAAAPAYGSNVAVVEPHGLEAIEPAERHGRPRDLFALWFGANAETATFAVGIIAVALYGTSLYGALLGLLIGNLLGYAVVAAVSRAGPRFGLPQMVVSRRAFGRDGNVLPAVLALLAGVGWFAIDSMFGAQALGALVHVTYPVALGVVVVVQIVLAVYGHNAIHAFEKAAGFGLLIGFVVIGAAVAAHFKGAAPFDPHAPFAAGGESAGIVFAAALAFAYALGWAPCASDYARYLPAASDPRTVSAWAFAGGFIPSMILECLGAAAVGAVRAPGLAAATPAETIGLLAGGNGAVATIGLLTVFIGTLSANALNLYSGALSALVAFDARRRLGQALAAGAALAAITVAFLVVAGTNDPGSRYPPGIVLAAALAVGALAFTVVRWTLRRWEAALAVGVLGGALAFAGADPAATAHLYENFLGLLTTWAAPWAGVVLGTRGETSQRSSALSLTAWGVGIAAGLPFWQQSWFAGPLAVAYPQLGDLSYFISFGVAFAVARYAGANWARSRK